MSAFAAKRLILGKSFMFELSISLSKLRSFTLFVDKVLSFQLNYAALSDRYETQNGILAQEEGQLKQTEDGNDALNKVGFYQYTGDDGKVYRVDYVADANGFQPTVCILLIFRVNFKRMKQIS